MTLDPAGVLRNAWRMAKGDRELLAAVGSFFLFLPQLALLLLLAPLPQQAMTGTDKEAMTAWLLALGDWYQANGVALVGASLVELFGTLTLFLLYLDASRPDAKGALIRALPLLPRFLLALMLISVPLGLTLLVTPLLVLPALYLEGRLLLALPAMVAERPLSIAGALRRSWALTRGHGLALAGMACIVFFTGPLLALPFSALGKTLDGAPMANPVVAALLDGAASAGAAIGAVAGVLIQVALYRRLAQPIRGI